MVLCIESLNIARSLLSVGNIVRRVPDTWSSALILSRQPIYTIGQKYHKCDKIIQAQALELQVFTQNIWASRSGASLGVGDIFPPKVIV